MGDGSADCTREAGVPAYLRESRLVTVDSGAAAREREDRRLAIQRVVWIGGVIAWPLFALTDYLDASNSPRHGILGTLLWLRFAGWVISGALLYVLRKPNRSDAVLAACDVLGFGTYSLLTAVGALVIGGLGVNVCLGIMIVAFMRASLLPSHWGRAFLVATYTMLLLPATVLVGAAFDHHTAEAWLGPGRIEPLVYSLSLIMAGVAVGSVGCHMAWQARRKVFAARQLGKYRLKARIGSGAMGDVWLARQELLGRDVAVKVLRSTGGDEGGELRKRFAREAKAASLLRHPNTIRVIEYGADEERNCFIAMELLDGLDLAALVERDGPLPAWRVLHLAVQACGSLAEAHELGIVHRDIKPANIFVTSVGEEDDFVKILDFGTARMVEGDGGAGMTKIGSVFGTPAYMSPEACRGEPADARTDIYALGAVLYFMLTGRQVFRTRSVADTFAAQLTQTPDPPSAHVAGEEPRDVPRDLEAIVMRCLAKERDKRFQDAHELEAALRGCAEFRPSGRRVDISGTVKKRGLSEAPTSVVVAPDPPSPDELGEEREGDERPRTTNVGELEERRRAFVRVLWITCLVAWPFFIVTDVLDAVFSHRAGVLPTVLALRLGCVLVSAVLLMASKSGAASARRLAAYDVLGFAAFSLLVSLVPVFLPGLEERAILCLMVVAFMRASLVPSNWSRAFAVALLVVAIFPLTLLVAGLVEPARGAAWLSEAGNLTYALGQVVAASAIGAVASHMTWRAERQVLEARKLGQYRLKTRLGSGATGDVWRARQETLDRDVALKVLRTRGDEDVESLRRFAREAKAASSLRHPNTIRIIEYGASDDGVYFIAMELLDGMELEKLVKRDGALDASLVIHLAIQACGSLAEAHSLAIVHRDIKPANLFVTRVGDDANFLKLLDFGIAQLLDGDPSATARGEGLFGTPAYMSPEACCGEATDARSDIYSLGAAMYFMLTGTDVFPGQTFAQMLVSHVQEPPEPLADRLRGAGRAISADLERVVMRCLSKRAEDRFASARDLEAALRACGDCREDAQGSARAA
jgi:serine/threonine protein kinase